MLRAGVDRRAGSKGGLGALVAATVMLSVVSGCKITPTFTHLRFYVFTFSVTGGWIDVYNPWATPEPRCLCLSSSLAASALGSVGTKKPPRMNPLSAGKELPDERC